MSKRKGPMTAEELIKQLEGDAEYQLRRERNDQRQAKRAAEHARIEQPILADLDTASFGGESIEAVVKNHAPLPKEAVEILLRWLKSLNQENLEDRASHARLVESVVRALAATRLSFDGRPLVDCFENTSDEGLKWAIANTIALTVPHSIDEWLTEKLKHRYWGKTLRELGLER